MHKNTRIKIALIQCLVGNTESELIMPGHKSHVHGPSTWRTV